jgi:peptide/nickel transport system permease protein
VERSERETSSGKDITLVYTFDFDYDTFPQDLSIFFTSQYVERQPFVSVSWLTPDGREIRLGDLSIRRSEAFRIAQDSRLQRRLRGYNTVQQGLFAEPGSDPPGC